jgi:hypothetical protein
MDPTTCRGSTASLYLEDLRKATNIAEESLKKAKDEMKRHWDQNKGKEAFRPGDQVLVQADYLLSNRSSRKLDNKWRGPFEVISKKGEATYELKFPLTWRGHKVLNTS